jgi:hypothetical protein
VRDKLTTNTERQRFLDAMQSLQQQTLWSGEWLPYGYDVQSGQVIAVRFDASRLISSVACPKRASLQAALLSILGSRFCSKRSPFPVDEPFRPLSDEWVLTPRSLRSQLPEGGALSVLDRSYAEDECILDRTIDWRGCFADDPTNSKTSLPG